MKFIVKAKGPGSIKGSGKNTLGADKRGRGHWRKLDQAGHHLELRGGDPDKASDRKFARNLNKIKVNYGPGSPGHPDNDKKPRFDRVATDRFIEKHFSDTKEEELQQRYDRENGPGAYHRYKAHEAEWNEWRNSFKDPQGRIRGLASRCISLERGPEGKGHGISSSDGNYEMFEHWKRGGKTVEGMINSMKEYIRGHSPEGENDDALYWYERGQ